MRKSQTVQQPCLLIQETRAVFERCQLKILRYRLPNVRIRRAPADKLRVYVFAKHNNRYVFARVVGTFVGRVAPVIGRNKYYVIFIKLGR